jgi:hypothetical protein
VVVAPEASSPAAVEVEAEGAGAVEPEAEADPVPAPGYTRATRGQTLALAKTLFESGVSLPVWGAARGLFQAARSALGLGALGELDAWGKDVALTAQLEPLASFLFERYWRVSVQGAALLPRGPALIVANHSGALPVYGGSKAFLDQFSLALRRELEPSGITVTCLMPGATDTEFFERADMLDTRIGRGDKDDPADVARAGFEAMMHGEAEVVTGWRNKLRAAIASVAPHRVLAEAHRRAAKPGSAEKH